MIEKMEKIRDMDNIKNENFNRRGGRFHAFDLAQYLNENKLLEKLITFIQSFILKEIIKILILKGLIQLF